ncbi:hypothetical protein Rhein_1261 [Rheinheimera sp. A13L]|uniref:DUF3299 domain-containing protein n=1 Tax=Rheinheimera sp. A13L TaxID=506534 RepID=UPI0002124A16|nr:DUF3299 domain-containing protein [Rheinheimera sp. A13L]EGM78689.1 hypothetical protein Rhein_1261 [Rheinheimera sp. A13L]
MVKSLYMALILTLVAFTALPAKAEDYKTLEWTDLLPEEDLKKMEQLPEISHEGGEVPAGSPLNQAYANQDPAAAAWNEVLMSANVKGELNNKKVRVPGFIVPVEYDADQNVTAFFLVPYFGACIHVPPPPPNQIIFVTNKQKIQGDMIYSPFWISGTLTTETMSHDLAKSAYSMKADKIEEYSYE